MNFHNVETQTAKVHFAESFPRVYRVHNQIKNIVLMMLLVPMSFVANAAELQANMSVSPEQCVAMSQGQECYVSVELTWNVNVPGNYCLYSSAQKNALSCWNSSMQGSYKKAFNTRMNLEFSLKRQSEQQTLVTSVVKMAWVHKKKGQPRTSWRLF